jgi:hypothetical protein
MAGLSGIAGTRVDPRGQMARGTAGGPKRDVGLSGVPSLATPGSGLDRARPPRRCPWAVSADMCQRYPISLDLAGDLQASIGEYRPPRGGLDKSCCAERPSNSGRIHAEPAITGKCGFPCATSASIASLTGCRVQSHKQLAELPIMLGLRSMPACAQGKSQTRSTPARNENRPSVRGIPPIMPYGTLVRRNWRLTHLGVCAVPSDDAVGGAI